MNNTFKKRIDELGRIVIPKQIRNTFKIKNFDELELYIEDDSIVLKKTGGILLEKEILDKLLVFLKKYLLINAFIVDKNIVISSNIENINYEDKIIVDVDNFSNNNERQEIELKENFKINGYIKNYQLIIDSNLYGNIIFVLENPLEERIDLLKDVVSILIDLLK